MQELMTKIVGLLTTAGGVLPYRDVLEGIDYQERRLLIGALRQLESEGIASRRVGSKAVDGEVTHTIVLTGGE